jgi:hypothetical protein
MVIPMTDSRQNQTHFTLLYPPFVAETVNDKNNKYIDTVEKYLIRMGSTK